MLDVEKKQQILEQFATYLDTVSENPERTENTTQTEIDLFRLFTELAALKAEVKIESRQVKIAIAEFQSLIELLRNNNEQLNRELLERRQQFSEDEGKIEKPLLMAMLDLRDRLDAGVLQAQNYRPGWWARRDKEVCQHVQVIHEGMEISLRRLDVLLERYDIKPLAAVGELLDPHTMQVNATQQQVGQDDGIVLQEIRKGYFRQAQILRLAEVIVNKNATTP